MKANIAALLRNPKFWASLVGLGVAVGLVAAADEAALAQALQMVAESVIRLFSSAGS